MSEQRKIRVLVVDDSAIVRKILSDTINAEPDMEVIGTAPDPFIARDKILALKPDVLTLDIEMPRMDGLTFLKKLMQFRPMPVIVISSVPNTVDGVSLEALSLGAVEVLAKPGDSYSVGDLREALPFKLRAAANARIRQSTPPPPVPLKPVVHTDPLDRAFHPDTLIAIGASTGGTQAIYDVLVKLPANTPGIAITQHIPKIFSAAFAQRLNGACAFEVKEACDGDELASGRALVAPGDRHMVIRRYGSSYRVQLQDGPKVCYQRPAVDVMFASIALAAKQNAVGVLLTGMGADGAQGLLSMHKAGASTMTQDETSCVVYGMPREAVRLGASRRVLPLHTISAAIVAEAAALLDT